MRRRIELDGCFNFRDLGGYPTADGRRVRWRRLFRSDALHHLTPRDVAVLVDELGLRHVVDLRSSGELGAEGRGPLAAAPTSFHHLPLFDGAIPVQPEAPPPETLADRYFLLARFAAGPIAKVLETLAASEGPTVYHCAAGKDRTGVISAVLLELLGVPDEVIVADYAASQEKLDAIIDRLLASEGYQGMLEALPEDTFHAEAGTMAALLARLRGEFGSIEAFATGAGLSGASLARLRAALLETA